MGLGLLSFLMALLGTDLTLFGFSLVYFIFRTSYEIGCFVCFFEYFSVFELTHALS